MTVAQENPFDEKGQHALDAALDWTKVTTGLATGALVFGIGLSTSTATSLPWVRYVLAAAWVLFFIAVVAGIFAQASLPILMRSGKYDLEARPFTWPARVHQITFLFAILCLSLVLIRILFEQPASDSITAPTAVEALTLAEKTLPPGSVVRGVNLIQLIKPTDSTSQNLSVWQVQLKVLCPTINTRRQEVIADYLVQALSGAVVATEPNSCKPAYSVR